MQLNFEMLVKGIVMQANMSVKRRVICTHIHIYSTYVHTRISCQKALIPRFTLYLYITIAVNRSEAFVVAVATAVSVNDALMSDSCKQRLKQ